MGDRKVCASAFVRIWMMRGPTSAGAHPRKKERRRLASSARGRGCEGRAPLYRAPSVSCNSHGGSQGCTPAQNTLRQLYLVSGNAMPGFAHEARLAVHVAQLPDSRDGLVVRAPVRKVVAHRSHRRCSVVQNVAAGAEISGKDAATAAAQAGAAPVHAPRAVSWSTPIGRGACLTSS